METLLIAFTLISSVLGYHEKTATVKVWGNCGMCKARIEKALKIDGVNKADWNVETKMLTVSYDSNTINLDQIQQVVATSGHDTEKFRSADLVYVKLPGCCRYDREKEKTDN
ncbi:MAG: heavy-metal-associated domain-containing protein [Pyrinomonadaceae bacterium]|nr:heavy-metal-associated domain-containing protein [Sphingobacteriaceae bacterium]